MNSLKRWFKLWWQYAICWLFIGLLLLNLTLLTVPESPAFLFPLDNRGKAILAIVLAFAILFLIDILIKKSLAMNDWLAAQERTALLKRLKEID